MHINLGSRQGDQIRLGTMFGVMVSWRKAFGMWMWNQGHGRSCEGLQISLSRKIEKGVKMASLYYWEELWDLKIQQWKWKHWFEFWPRHWSMHYWGECHTIIRTKFNESS
jgi:hypothetical protein